MRLNGLINPVYLSWVRQAASHVLSGGHGVDLTYLDLNCTFHTAPRGKVLRNGRSDLAKGVNPVKRAVRAARSWRAATGGGLNITPGDLAKRFGK